MTLGMVITICVTVVALTVILAHIITQILKTILHNASIPGEEECNCVNPDFMADCFKVATLKLQESGFVVGSLSNFSEELIEEYNTLVTNDEYRTERIAKYNTKIDEDRL